MAPFAETDAVFPVDEGHTDEATVMEGEGQSCQPVNAIDAGRGRALVRSSTYVSRMSTPPLVPCLTVATVPFGLYVRMPYVFWLDATC